MTLSPAITTAAALEALCRRLSGAAFIALDTEFLRERTYRAQLCLIQIAGPDAQGHVIDPLSPEIGDLSPLGDLLHDPCTTKVLHAARQDIEIFFTLWGRVPAPLFDTQIAAMVCGCGDQVSYEQLCLKLEKVRIRKEQRFTDWRRRPLTDRQLAYALADVTHLVPVYRKLLDLLESRGRREWIAGEMAQLLDPGNYAADPAEAWRRLKSGSSDPHFLGALRAIAAWREQSASARNLPRRWVLKDEAVQEIAAENPATPGALAALRSVPQGLASGPAGEEIIRALAGATPLAPERTDTPGDSGAAGDLLRVLLKQRADEHGVAARLIATATDLDRLATGRTDVPALAGWRRQLFGEDALKLLRGELAMAPGPAGRGRRDRRGIRLMPVPAAATGGQGDGPVAAAATGGQGNGPATAATGGQGDGPVAADAGPPAVLPPPVPPVLVLERLSPVLPVPVPLRLCRGEAGAGQTDHNGHVGEGFYLYILGGANDAFLFFAGLDRPCIDGGFSVFTAETHLRHLHQTVAGEPFRVETLLIGCDDKRIRLFHRMTREADGQLLVRAEHLLLGVSTVTGRVTPFPPQISERLGQIAAAHGAGGSLPEGAGQAISMEGHRRRKTGTRTGHARRSPGPSSRSHPPDPGNPRGHEPSP